MRTNSVKQTCLKIDEVIEKVNWSHKLALDFYDGLRKASFDEIEDTFGDIVAELEGLDKILEEVRSANIELRDIANDLEEELEDLEHEFETYRLENE